MKSTAGSTLHIYTEGTRKIGVRASRRYFDTATKLAQYFSSHQFIDKDGPTSAAELQYVRHGGRPAVLEGLKQLQPEFAGPNQRASAENITWPSGRSVGFHFSNRIRSKLHDVEIQCITSLEDCFSDELNKPHKNFVAVTNVQRAIETSDLIVTPCRSTARELHDYFGVPTDRLFVLPPPPFAFVPATAPPIPTVSIVLVDGLSTVAKAEALQCGGFLRSQLPDFATSVCWDMENGETKDNRLLNTFDLVGPLRQSQKVRLMSAAHATILIGSSPTTDGIMQEARLSQRLAAPRIRGYEPIDVKQSVLRYEPESGAAVAALRRLLVSAPSRPSGAAFDNTQYRDDTHFTTLHTAIEKILDASN